MAANVNYNLRNSHNIHVPFNRLSVYQNSYFPCTIQAWNSLDLNIRNLPTFSSFKLKLQQIFHTKRRNPQYYSIGDRFLSVLRSRMRNKCSALNADLYHANLIVNYNCLYLDTLMKMQSITCYTVTDLPYRVLLCYLN